MMFYIEFKVGSFDPEDGETMLQWIQNHLETALVELAGACPTETGVGPSIVLVGLSDNEADSRRDRPGNDGNSFPGFPGDL